MLWLLTSSLLFVIGLIVIVWVHNQHHHTVLVEAALPAPDGAPISVCIPARDEEDTIRACVASVLAQDYSHFEVIVVDDRSTDGTSSILKKLAAHDARLRIVAGVDLPGGWAGKPHALHQAAEVARGEWLCFVDADTTLAPNALSACIATAIAHDADLFTTLHQQIMLTPWEKMMMPLIMTALSVAFTPRKVNDPARRDAVANGQFILIRRREYDSIGGHRMVRDRIVEDKALAELVKWSAGRLVIADGSAFIRTRMYRSLTQMWEGWTKNIYLGLRDHPSTLALGIFGAVLAILAAVFVPVWPLIGIAWRLNHGGWMAQVVIAEALVIWVALLWARAAVARRMKIPIWYSLTTPIGAAVFAAMMLASAWKVLSGRGVTWRGRRYHQNSKLEAEEHEAR